MECNSFMVSNSDSVIPRKSGVWKSFIKISFRGYNHINIKFIII